MIMSRCDPNPSRYEQSRPAEQHQHDIIEEESIIPLAFSTAGIS